MPMPLIHKPEYEKFRAIPDKIRSRLLRLRARFNVAKQSFTLCKHGSGKTWRLRWYTRAGHRGRHYSLSIGSDPLVVELVRDVLELWKRGEFPLVALAHPFARVVPSMYYDAWIDQEWEEMRKAKRLPTTTEAPLVRFLDSAAAREGYYAPTCDVRSADSDCNPDLEIYRVLPPELAYRLLLLQKEVNVLTNRLHVVSRPERGTWCLRWREVVNGDEIRHRSINLGKDPCVAEAVKQLIVDWRNWKTPLFDLLFPGQAIPPEYWGIDWAIRAQIPPSFSPISREVMERMRIKLAPQPDGSDVAEKTQKKMFQEVQAVWTGGKALEREQRRAATDRRLRPMQDANRKILRETLAKGHALLRDQQKLQELNA